MKVNDLEKDKKYFCYTERKDLYYMGKMFKGKFEFSDILGDPYLLTKEEVEKLERS